MLKPQVKLQERTDEPTPMAHEDVEPSAEYDDAFLLFKLGAIDESVDVTRELLSRLYEFTNTKRRKSTKTHPMAWPPIVSTESKIETLARRN